MKRFKLFIASVLTYFMAMSILPTSLLQTVVNAAENEYTTLVKSDYYLRSNQQYGNRSLIAYYSEKENKVIISKVEGGKETVLKEVDGYQTASISKYNDNTAVIKYTKNVVQVGEILFYEKYNLNSNTFENAKPNEWQESNIEDSNLRPVAITEDAEVKDLIKKIIKENNIDLDIDSMYRAYDGYYNVMYKDSENQIFANIYRYPNSGNIIEYEIGYGKIGEGHRVKEGIILNDFIYKAQESMDRSPHVEFSYDSVNNIVFIYDELEWDYESNIYKYKVSEVKDNKVISEGIMEGNIGYYPNESFKENDILYINLGMKLAKYRLTNGIYDFLGEIELYSYSESINKFDKSYWYVENKGNEAYLSKIKGNNEISIIKLDSERIINNDLKIIVYDNDNILLKQYNRFTIVQNKNNVTPTIPGEPTTPEKPGDNENNENVVIRPSDDKVIAEVSKINSNEKNEIAIKTESEVKNVEVVLKDIEALKSGKGSLNISVNNSMKMNLPLSLIDSELLQGASDVTIKLDILENSDILKDKNAVNKVFDFNLIINREDGQVNVHNFKDGLAEVEILLSDKDLEGLNKDKLVVYYYNDADKTFEAMETSVEGNKVTFKTSHFSKYVIAEKVEGNNGAGSPSVDTSTESNDTSSNNSETGKGNLPETGARVSSTTIFVVALGIMAIGGAMFFRKRRHA
ncbi:LPXTG cell wall anchor domain-containing protein [Clostridium sp.]|uniref:LPXTG cell wall anchor domain-containing protein n=1 Tax=Clostridium sp. TaxID=1506 RepID=UPI001E0B0A9A|nr:LPXTG cell wall anchor domain-containing protein [Clostridium sp.]MBS5306018.1 LPXTG cell wall anchor domain-containing protein [Clostridium sp.]